MTITVRIEVPAWLERLVLPAVLLYRRWRFGYGFRRIPLTQGLFAIVDPDDYAELSRYRWHANRGRGTFYAQRKVWDPATGTERTIKMHRQILNCPAHLVVDHINHHGLDNRQANLRQATPAQNVCNSRPVRNPKKAAISLPRPSRPRRGRTTKDTALARRSPRMQRYPVAQCEIADAKLTGHRCTPMNAVETINTKCQMPNAQFRGVSFHKQRRRYYARIRVGGRTIALGYFDDPVEAAKVRDAAAREHHGPFATLNFPHLRLLAVGGRVRVRVTVRAALTVLPRDTSR